VEDFKKYSFYQQYFLKNFQRPKDIRSSSRRQRSFEANKGQPTKQAKLNISQEATRNSAGRSSPKRKQPNKMAALQRKLVHKQFNSPMGLYSQENVKATLNRELKAFGGEG